MRASSSAWASFAAGGLVSDVANVEVELGGHQVEQADIDELLSEGKGAIDRNGQVVLHAHPALYTIDGVEGYRSGDYRMAPLSSHLFGLALNFDGSGMAAPSEIVSRMGVTLRWERYFNSNNYSANFLTTQLGYRF